MIKKILQDYLNVVLVSYLLLSGSVMAEKNAAEKTAVAIFAGGCFWCMEPPFDALPGVISTISGYTGGHTENPTYREVSNGKTGHVEAVEVTYDPAKITYDKLLEVFWHNIDPFDDDGQFCDKGDPYKAVIFYQDEKEKQLAEAAKTAAKTKLPDEPIVISIKPAGKFFPAEEYHQDYYLKNPKRYKFYRFTCGRDQRLSQVWGE
ncbi:peptide-methionine (S)-S-oxide reductase MsrA [Methyloglobulus sp.]|uniref:peptide-methionine (S)-S-oxide reductase MsrA n=1 Tax=Methyloglobulus sp. TaxID=2518622 RepID=UPI00398920EC